MISKIENLLAFRYLRPRRKDAFLKTISIFSFTGIALGVSILIIVMSVMNGFRSELIDKILGFNPHIVVKPYNNSLENKDIKKIQSSSSKILKTVFSYNGEAILINQEKSKGIIVRGYFKNDINKIKLLKSEITEGSLGNFEKNTISIGKELAISSNLVVGDKVTLMSTSSIQTPFGNLPIQKSYTISSIFSSGLIEFDQNVIFMPIENIISLFDASKKDLFLEIYLKNPENVESAKKEIQNMFQEYYVYSWNELNKSFFGALKIERNVMFIILTLIVIVAAFNIISGLTILVKNKTKEIAILRTLGISARSIAKIFFITGFTIGFFATITGVIFGILFSLYIEEIRMLITYIFNISLFPEEIYFLSKMPSEINISSILIISFFSLLVTIIATIFPSLSAAKLDPVKSLKHE